MSKKLYKFKTLDANEQQVELAITYDRQYHITCVYLQEIDGAVLTCNVRVGWIDKLDGPRPYKSMVDGEALWRAEHKKYHKVGHAKTRAQATQDLLDFFYPQWVYMKKSPEHKAGSMWHFGVERGWDISRLDESKPWALSTFPVGEPNSPTRQVIGTSYDKSLLEAWLQTRSPCRSYLCSDWFFSQEEVFASKGPQGQVAWPYMRFFVESVGATLFEKLATKPIHRALVVPAQQHPEDFFACMEWVMLKYATLQLKQMKEAITITPDTGEPVSEVFFADAEELIAARYAVLSHPSPEAFAVLHEVADRVEGQNYMRLVTRTKDSVRMLSGLDDIAPAWLKAYGLEEATRLVQLFGTCMDDIGTTVRPSIKLLPRHLDLDTDETKAIMHELFAKMVDLLAGGGQRLGMALFEGTI